MHILKEPIRLNKIPVHRVLIIAVFAFTLLIMNGTAWGEPGFRVYSNGAGILDMRLGYSANDVYQLFRILGVEGRDFYARFLFLDFIFIGSFALVQNYLLKRIMGNVVLKSGWRYLLSISYLRGLFDIIENILFLVLLFSFPLELTGVVVMASFSTLLKFILLGLWLFAIPTLLVIKKIHRKKGKK